MIPVKWKIVEWPNTGQRRQISVRIGRYVCLRFITARSTLPNYDTRVVRFRDKYIAVNKLLISILAPKFSRYRWVGDAWKFEKHSPDLDSHARVHDRCSVNRFIRNISYMLSFVRPKCDEFKLNIRTCSEFEKHRIYYGRINGRTGQFVQTVHGYSISVRPAVVQGENFFRVRVKNGG